MTRVKKFGLIMACLLACILLGESAQAKKTQEFIPGDLAQQVKPEKALLSSKERGKKVELPTQYDGRNYGYLPAVRDQGDYGTCWVFSSQGAAMATIKKESIASSIASPTTPSAFSEWQQFYWMYNVFSDPLGLTTEDKAYCDTKVKGEQSYGGSPEAAAFRYASWIGVMPNDKASYEQFTSLGDKEDITLPDATAYSEDSYHLKKSEMYGATDKEAIKRAVLEYGAGTISVNTGNTKEEQLAFMYDDYTYVYQNKYTVQNHAVLIVGWDDNLSRTHFNPENQPAKDGAWLCQNSWGTNYKENGYFWLSYEDATLTDENTACFYELEDASKYDNNYQYDNSAASVWQSGVQKAANIFTSQYKETLSAVSIVSPYSGMNYKLRVYKNPTADNPDSGTQIGKEITGSVNTKGNYVIDLEENGGTVVPLEKGDRFSIVIECMNKETNTSGVMAEEILAFSNVSNRVNYDAEPGESFYQSEDTNGWEDFGEAKSRNICLKGLTKVDKSIAVNSFDISDKQIVLEKNKEADITFQTLPENATDTRVIWQSNNTSVVQAVNGRLYGIASGSAIVTGTANGHTDSVTVKVIEYPVTSIECDDVTTVPEHSAVSLGEIITPAATTDNITYEISDEDAKYIREVNHQIYGISPITGAAVTIKADSGMTKTVHVNVTERSPETMTLEDMQSPHTYISNCNEVWKYRRANAIGYYVTFDNKTCFEEGYDFLHILNDEGDKVSSYTGTGLAGQRIYVTGSSLQLQLEADMYYEEYGFRLTEITPVYGVTPTPLPTPTLVPVPTMLPTQAPASPVPTTAVSTTKHKLILRKSQLCLAVGKKLKVTANQTGVRYQVSPAKYAKISSSGVITAKKAGAGKTVTIVAKKNGWLTAKSTVRIYKSPIKRIKTTNSKIVGKPGKTVKLTKYFSTLPKKNTCKAVRYSVSKEKYGKIKGDILYLAKSAKGKKVKVTVYAQDGSGKKAVLNIHVK